MSKAKKTTKKAPKREAVIIVPITCWVRADLKVLTPRQEAEIMAALTKILGAPCTSADLTYGCRMEEIGGK